MPPAQDDINTIRARLVENKLHSEGIGQIKHVTFTAEGTHLHHSLAIG